jgi:hypothetical protein
MSLVKFFILWRMLKVVVLCRHWRSKLCDWEVIVQMKPRAHWRTAFGVCCHSVRFLVVRNVQRSNYPLGTMRPLYRTGVSLLSRERFLYI